VNGVNQAAVYCLLPNKTRGTYGRLVAEIKNLARNASPKTIRIDFKAAAMGAFTHGYSEASVTGCYFH